MSKVTRFEEDGAQWEIEPTVEGFEVRAQRGGREARGEYERIFDSEFYLDAADAAGLDLVVWRMKRELDEGGGE